MITITITEVHAEALLDKLPTFIEMSEPNDTDNDEQAAHQQVVVDALDSVLAAIVNAQHQAVVEALRNGKAVQS
jgi:hypothetical protein